MTSALLPLTLTSTGTASVGETVLFACVALVAVLCGIGVLTSKRAVYSAVNMILLMISLAVLYVTNDAPFLGITQIVVYTGAIMTLVLFVIMLVGVGADETVDGSHRGQKGIIGVLGLALVGAIVAVVAKTQFAPAVGLSDTVDTNPESLAVTLFSGHVVAMELTGILLITAAVGALTLTHRDKLTPNKTQRELSDERLRAYVEDGVHPGQLPFSGVYASNNSLAAPALTDGEQAVTESVSPVLRTRSQELSLGEVAPQIAKAARSNEATPVRKHTGQSGMPSMPGVAAPRVAQPMAPTPEPAEPSEADAAEPVVADEKKEAQS